MISHKITWSVSIEFDIREDMAGSPGKVHDTTVRAPTGIVTAETTTTVFHEVIYTSGLTSLKSTTCSS